MASKVGTSRSVDSPITSPAASPPTSPLSLSASAVATGQTKGMEEATYIKTKNVLRKSYKELPIAKDLPRLASRIRVEDAEGKNLLQETLPPGSGPTAHCLNLLRALYSALEGAEKAKAIETSFNALFEGNTAMERIIESKLDNFLSTVMGGDESRIVRLLKCCNQSAIAGAVTELKIKLGTGNTTKDVPNSWVFIVTIGENNILVRNKKREQAIDGLFSFEWELVFVYDKQINSCEDISLKVTDLAFNPQTTQEKIDEVNKLLSKYLEQTSAPGSPAPTRVLENTGDEKNIDLLPGETILFKDKNCTYIHSVGSAPGIVFVTNFRVAFEPTRSLIPAVDGMQKYRTVLLKSVASTEVPLAHIFQIKKKSDTFQRRNTNDVYIQTKDLRIIVFSFTKNTHSRDNFVQSLGKSMYNDIQNVFAFAYATALKEQERRTGNRDERNYWEIYVPALDFQRLKVPNERWRACPINAEYQLCSSYPAQVWVPKGLNDDEIKAVAKYRSKEKIPCLCWRSPNNITLIRAGTPTTNSRCVEDEKLLDEIMKANPNNVLYVLDVGEKSKGNQDSYKNTKFEQLELEPINNLRESLRKFAKIVNSTNATNQETWFSSLHTTHWLHHIASLLAASYKIVDHLERGRSVLVQESEKTDRLPQLLSITQILTDPYYRTVEGFCCLIEKEWLSFGHRIMERCSTLLPSLEKGEFAPIFLQFLDATWQVVDQFPNSFEFNTKFLLTIIYHAYSGLYGTFLCDSDEERQKIGINKTTISLWSFLISNWEFRNLNYAATSRVLVPSTSMKRLRLWVEYYFRWDPEVQGSESCVLEQISPTQARKATFELPSSAAAATESVGGVNIVEENKKLLRQMDQLKRELEQMKQEKRLLDRLAKEFGRKSLDLGRLASEENLDPSFVALAAAENLSAQQRRDLYKIQNSSEYGSKKAGSISEFIAGSASFSVDRPAKTGEGSPTPSPQSMRRVSEDQVREEKKEKPEKKEKKKVEKEAGGNLLSPKRKRTIEKGTEAAKVSFSQVPLK